MDLGPRGTGPSRGGPCVPENRPGDHDPRGEVGSGACPARHLRRGGRRASRVVIGHADSYPVLDHYLEILRRGANLEFDFLGMSFTPIERLGEDRVVELLCELLARGHAERILLSQNVCHDSQLTRYEGRGYVYLTEAFLPRLRAAGVSDAEIETLTVLNPRRVLTIG